LLWLLDAPFAFSSVGVSSQQVVGCPRGGCPLWPQAPLGDPPGCSGGCPLWPQPPWAQKIMRFRVVVPMRRFVAGLGDRRLEPSLRLLADASPAPLRLALAT